MGWTQVDSSIGFIISGALQLDIEKGEDERGTGNGLQCNPSDGNY